MIDRNHQLGNEGGDDVMILALDGRLTESAEANEYRRRITAMAWNKLPATHKESLRKATKTLAAGDAELEAVYSQSVLIVDYVNQRANINTDPSALLPAENYRFWS